MTMSRGCDVKSRTGIGIFLEMYSQITSMLYLSCADIGTIGAPSATVPVCQCMHVCMHKVALEPYNFNLKHPISKLKHKFSSS